VCKGFLNKNILFNFEKNTFLPKGLQEKLANDNQQFSRENMLNLSAPA
jgi:hypothetical protein